MLFAAGIQHFEPGDEEIERDGGEAVDLDDDFAANCGGSWRLETRILLARLYAQPPTTFTRPSIHERIS